MAASNVSLLKYEEAAPNAPPHPEQPTPPAPRSTESPESQYRIAGLGVPTSPICQNGSHRSTPSSVGLTVRPGGSRSAAASWSPTRSPRDRWRVAGQNASRRSDRRYPAVRTWGATSSPSTARHQPTRRSRHYAYAPKPAARPAPAAPCPPTSTANTSFAQASRDRRDVELKLGQFDSPCLLIC